MSESFYLKAIALVMLYLTLSLLYVPAQAMAVLQGELHGQDNIPGIRRATDASVVTATASSDQVQVCDPGFSTCKDMSCSLFAPQIYECTLSFSAGTQAGGQYLLGLKQATGSPAQTIMSYAVDALPPRFRGFTISQSGERLTANYNVVDEAGPGASRCAGLDAIDFIVGGNVVASEQLGGGCAETGAISADVPGLNDVTTFQVVARDAFGQQGESAVIERATDTTPPMLPDTFSLRTAGREVTRVSTTTPITIPATLIFNITDNNFRRAIVDASNLTTDPAKKAQYHALSFTPRNCVKNGDVYECRYPNLQLKPSGPQLTIRIDAVDRSNNRATAPVTKTVEVINDAPQISCMNTGRPPCEPCENCYIKGGLTQLVTQVEAPGGMVGNSLILDAQKTGGPAATVSPPTCTQERGGWTCTHRVNVPFGSVGDVFEVRVRGAPFSHDDVFNPFDGTFKKYFLYDDVPPRIVTDPDFDSGPCPIGGQTIEVHFQVRELGSTPVAYANTSGLAAPEPEPTPCEPTDLQNIYDCVVPLQLVSDTLGGDVKVIVEDGAGSKDERTLHIDVCEQDATTTPNYIRSIRATVRQPPVIDDRIANVVPFRVAIPLELDIIRGARVMETVNVICTTTREGDRDDDTALQDFVDASIAPTLVRDHTSHPVLEIYYLGGDGMDWPEGELRTTCTLQFKMRRGHVVYEIPEEETIFFDLPLAGRTLENPAQAFEKQQRALLREIRSLQGKIDHWAKWDDRLSMFCNIVGTLVLVNGAVQVVRTVLVAIGLALRWIYPIGKAIFSVGSYIGCQFNQLTETIGFSSNGNGVATVLSQSNNPGGNLLAFILAPALSRFAKVICGIYSCNFYKASTYINIGMNYAAVHGWMGEGAQQVNREGHGVYSEYRAAGEPVSYEFTYDPSTGQVTGWGPYGSPDSSFTHVRGGLPVTQQPDGSFTYATGRSARVSDLTETVDITVSDKQKAANRHWAEGAYSSDWIINPYRSARFDALCLPAHLYNLRKAQQIKCLQYKCREDIIETASNMGTGLSTAICDKQARVLQCLYVEGAMGGLGDKTFWRMLLEGMIMVAWGILVGLILARAMQALCGQEYDLAGNLLSPVSTQFCPKGAPCQTCYTTAYDYLDKTVPVALCGLLTAYQELSQYNNLMKNPFDATSDPGTDFCSEVPI